MASNEETPNVSATHRATFINDAAKLMSTQKILNGQVIPFCIRIGLNERLNNIDKLINTPGIDTLTIWTTILKEWPEHLGKAKASPGLLIDAAIDLQLKDLEEELRELVAKYAKLTSEGDENDDPSAVNAEESKTTERSLLMQRAHSLQIQTPAHEGRETVNIGCNPETHRWKGQCSKQTCIPIVVVFVVLVVALTVSLVLTLKPDTNDPNSELCSNSNQSTDEMPSSKETCVVDGLTENNLKAIESTSKCPYIKNANVTMLNTFASQIPIKCLSIELIDVSSTNVYVVPAQFKGSVVKVAFVDEISPEDVKAVVLNFPNCSRLVFDGYQTCSKFDASWDAMDSSESKSAHKCENFGNDCAKANARFAMDTVEIEGDGSGTGCIGLYAFLDCCVRMKTLILKNTFLVESVFLLLSNLVEYGTVVKTENTTCSDHPDAYNERYCTNRLTRTVRIHSFLN